MNKTLSDFARQTLKDGLAMLPEKNKQIFKLTYCEPLNPLKRTPEVVAKIKGFDINDVVDAMPDEKLDWAMQQVENTITKMEALH